MNEDQKKAFEHALDQLPIAYQEAIRAYPWEERVVSIGTANKLYLNQIDHLTADVALVLAGLADADEFKDAIIDRIMLDDRLADELVRALNLEIFIPIREAVQKKTGAVQSQFKESARSSSPQPTVNTVFKVLPEKYTFTQNAKKESRESGDPYREPID